MRYLFDIGHPFDFHCFKNVIRHLLENKNDVLVTARDKDVTLTLLEKSGFTYTCTGKNLPTKLGKIFSLFRNDYRIYQAARRFKADVIVSFFSPFPAHAGRLLGKPVIGFHDTEIAGTAIRLALPFTHVVIVPECYRRPLPAEKKITFNGVFELAYLHPNYFTPLPVAAVREMLGLAADERYAVVRFVSHSALHDSGHRGLQRAAQEEAVAVLRQHARVFISAEEALPASLEQYRLQIPPENMHDVLFHAALLFGESATMASESAVLGTPAIYIDDRGRGYTDELEKEYGLVFNFKPAEAAEPTKAPPQPGWRKALDKAVEILETPGIEEIMAARRARLLSQTIDVTAFMIACIEK